MAAVDRQSLPVLSGGGKSGLHRAGSPFQLQQPAVAVAKEGYCGLYAAGRKVQQKEYRREPVSR